MKTYCVKRRDTENIDPKIVRTKNKRLKSKCSVCGIKKPIFVKEQ